MSGDPAAIDFVLALGRALHRSGVESMFAMFVVAASIVGGLLVANATLWPRRVL